MPYGFTLALGAASLVSIPLAIYFFIRTMQLHKTRYLYSWDDVQRGVWRILRKVQRSRFQPDILVTVTGSGAVIANLYSKLMGCRFPTYHAMLEDPREQWGYTPHAHRRVETNRWVLHIPESLLAEGKDKNILVLDSSFFSGDTIGNLMRVLRQEGFQSLLFATLVLVDQPEPAVFQPDIHYYENPTNEFYYPWGRA